MPATELVAELASGELFGKIQPGLDPVLAHLQAASLATDEGGFEDWVSVPKARRRGKTKRG